MSERITGKRIHRGMMPRKYDLPLLLACMLLTCIGILFIGSANITSSTAVVRDVALGVIKQGIFFAASLVAMVICARLFSFRLLKRLLKPGLMLVLVLLLGTLAFPPINDARAWIQISLGITSVTLQPVELAKVAMVLMTAVTMCNQHPKKTFWQVASPVIVMLAIYAFIVMFLQNDFGSAMVLTIMTVGCCLIPRHPSFKKPQRLVYQMVLAGIAAVVFILSPLGIEMIQHLPLKEYQINRFVTAVDPFSDRYGSGFQVSNSLIAFSRGGLFGKGIGASVQKYGYLPEADSDFILAVIAEETGVAGLCVIFFLYGVIVYRLLKYALLVKKDENKVILWGALLYIGIHFIFNVGGVTAFLPLTGIPLLMLSSGGTSLLSWYAMMGICQSVIARYRSGNE